MLSIRTLAPASCATAAIAGKSCTPKVGEPADDPGISGHQPDDVLANHRAVTGEAGLMINRGVRIT